MDLYDQERVFKKTLGYLDNWDMSENNKKLIRQFVVICGAENISLTRRTRYLYFMKIICRLLNKDLDKVDKEDIIELVGKINSMNYSPHTKKDFKIAIKKFYSSLFYETRKEFVEWMYEKRNRILKAVIKKSEQKKKAAVITKDEIIKIIEVADTRMKALVSVAFEGCLRPGEYLLARIKDLEVIEHGFKLSVEGKTGTRPIFLIESAPYLSRWLEIHPSKDDRNAFLFVTMAHNNKGRLFNLLAVTKQYKKICEKVKLDKPTNLYHLRHSGIMYKRQQNVPDDILEQYCGWVAGSSAKKAYYRQAGEETKSRIYELNGIEEKKEKFNDRKICFRCNERNGFADRLCNKCGTPLDKEEFSKIHEKQIFYDKIIEQLASVIDAKKLAQNKEIFELFRKLNS